jgi:hypothetical protein
MPFDRLYPATVSRLSSPPLSLVERARLSYSDGFAFPETAVEGLRSF